MVEFEFNCPECGQVIVVNEDLCGQFAECPYCKKNVVIPPSTESASVVEENDNVIPTGDFSEALAACRQDFDFNDTFTKASRIAQLFLGVKAYCIHFHKNFEDSEVADCLADIEKDLTLNDIDYLLSKEYDSLIRERLLGIRRIYTSVRTKDGMSLQHEKDSITNANSKQGFFSKVFLQPVKLFLGLKRGWLVSCSSCGWQGFVIASREEVIRCNNCGEFLPLKDATDAYEKVSGDERSLSQEYTRREKIRKDFFTRAEEFEFDWKIFSDPASQRKIERIKAYTERLYRKASSLNANRIIRATHSVAASNRTFGNTMEGGYGTFVSLIGSFELAADESAERKLASETTDIEEVIERNEAFVDHYYDIVDEFADVEKAAARARRLKRLCGYADESELPELDLLIDYDLLERCAVLEKSRIR